MGFLCQFISALGVFECALGMPVSAFIFPFFIVLGGCAMCVRRAFVFLSGFSV